VYVAFATLRNITTPLPPDSCTPGVYESKIPPAPPPPYAAAGLFTAPPGEACAPCVAEPPFC